MPISDATKPRGVTSPIGFLAIGAILVGGPAYSQLEEIVVTAQKRAESLQDVPIAITAFTGDQLRQNLITAPRDLFQRVPNVSLQTNATAGQLQLTIRGVGFSTFSMIGVQPVLVFQDEVVLNSPQVGGLFLYDLERVEVLRGPQNTLYGRNTTGGAVNYISRKPEIGGELTGNLDATIGNFDQLNLDAAIGAPIGENAAFRVALQSLNNDGYWENTAIPGDRMGERNQTMARAQLGWDAKQDLNVLFNVHGGVSEGGSRPIRAHGLFDASVTDEGDRFAILDDTGGNCVDIDIDDLETTCIDVFGDPTNPNNDEARSELSDSDIDDIETYGGSVNITWQLDDVEFNSITAYEWNSYDHLEDADGTAGPFVLFRQNSETDQISQEFRLTSLSDSQLRWIVGAFAFFEDSRSELSVPIFVDEGVVSETRQEDDLYSLYGQLDYDFTDRLRLTAGFRYVNETKTGGDRAVFYAAPPGELDLERPDNFLMSNLEAYRTDDVATAERDKTWDLYGGKLGIEYDASDTAMLYAHVSRGEKAGVFPGTEAVVYGQGGVPTNPEVVWAYEAGAKTSWYEGRLITNVALFYNDYRDQQLEALTTDAEGNLFTLPVNAARSRIYGFEFESQLALDDGWYFDLGVGYLNTEVIEATEFDLGFDTIAVELGRSLTNAPEWTLNGGIRKDFELAGSDLLTVSLDARYTSERTYDLIDTQETRPLVTDPSYVLLNGFMEYQFGEDNRYRVSVWGKNLTDSTYYAFMQEFGVGNLILFSANPRTYGATVGISF